MAVILGKGRKEGAPKSLLASHSCVCTLHMEEKRWSVSPSSPPPPPPLIYTASSSPHPSRHLISLSLSLPGKSRVSVATSISLAIINGGKEEGEEEEERRLSPSHPTPPHLHRFNDKFFRV